MNNAKKLEINTNGGTLIFEVVNELRWCVVSFRTDSGTVKLGAENVGILCGRITEKLSDVSNNKPFVLHDKEMYTITSLFEGHSTLIYSMLDGNAVQVLYGDAELRINPLFSLTEEERLDFLRKLEAFGAEAQS
ncbi:MAG: hypothetical protein IKW96_06680 [Ruminococcus sp.]|uniref:hypothetical protein n=1 Tax=Ruminococcus sp. TaxID=41978 RepID=UPI0025E01517|nr:hypothetical protein [Ruminococcus sp.]MBR5682949.1 hypothetical protein [Ruminococcus sp.]